MAQSLSLNYIHIIFSTKNREKTIRNEDLSTIHNYIRTILVKINCLPIIIGGTNDHIHILCSLNKNLSLSNMVKIIKCNSSQWIKEQNKLYRNFYWQSGFGAFSVSQSKIEIVKRYISNQDEHHKRISFIDEIKTFLIEYGVCFDEKYL